MSVFEYKQHSEYEAAFNPKRCKASVPRERVGFHQCLRKPWKNGWCKQHHPTSVKAREKKIDDRIAQLRRNYNKKWAIEQAEKRVVEAAIRYIEQLDGSVAPLESAVNRLKKARNG